MNVSSDMRSVFSCPHNPNFAWDPTDKIFPWVMVAIVSIASPAAVILNILVIAAVRSRKELQKHSNILLSSLAAADILVGTINMPLSATVDFVISRQVFNDPICTVDLVNVYLMYTLTACTLYHLTFIAWERYQAIRNCYENKAKLTRSHPKKLAITAWFLAAFTQIPGILLTALGIEHDFIVVAIAAFFALILIAYFYIVVYREARKAKQIITQVTVMVKTKLENAVAITCALVSTAVVLSFVPLVTVGLMGELYPGLRKSSAFRSAETLLQMNSVVNPLIYFYRNHRFRNIVLEILCIRNPPVAKSKVAPMQYVRSKDPFSKKGIQKHPNANSHHLLSRAASCELANVIELNRAMKKRPVSAPSIIRLHSNSFDSSQPQNPSSILTVVATVHPQRRERHRNSLPIFHPSSLTKRWEAKRNHFNLSNPAGDLIKKRYQFNNRKLSNHLPYLLPRSPTARVRQSEIWVQDYHLERSTAFGKGAGSYGISLRSRKGLLKRSMSAPTLREISSFRNDTLQREAPEACHESLDSCHL